MLYMYLLQPVKLKVQFDALCANQKLPYIFEFTIFLLNQWIWLTWLWQISPQNSLNEIQQPCQKWLLACQEYKPVTKNLHNAHIIAPSARIPALLTQIVCTPYPDCVHSLPRLCALLTQILCTPYPDCVHSLPRLCALLTQILCTPYPDCVHSLPRLCVFLHDVCHPLDQLCRGNLLLVGQEVLLGKFSCRFHQNSE